MSDDSKSKDDDKPENAGEGEVGASEEGEKKGLPVKKILIILIPLLLLIGGGAGAYFMGVFGGSAPPEKHKSSDDHAEGEEGAEGEHAAEDGELPGEEGGDDAHGEPAAAPPDDHGGKDDKAAGDGHGAPGAGGSQKFVKVADEKGQDLVVNLNSGDGQLRLLQLGVQLELFKSSDAPKIKAVMPRIIDQFQTYLRELRVKDLRGSAGIYRLQMELLARVNQAAAPVKVKDVLFEKILIQ